MTIFIGLFIAMMGFGPVAEAEQPNIVVFFVDDMGWQDTSVPFHTERTALNDRYHTPNMERLAASGVKFTQAYAYAVCSPSRVSIMTGQSASRHGVTNWTLRKDQQPDTNHPKITAAKWNLNGLQMEEGIARTVVAKTLPQVLREAGYRTIHAGKAHFGAKTTPGENPLNLGFDVNIAGHCAGGPGSYHGERNYSAAWRKGNRIWDVPGLEKYHGTKTNLTEAITIESLAALDEAVAMKKPFYLYLSHYAIHAPFEVDHRFIERYRNEGLSGIQATYASMITSMDHSLGDVLDYLDEHELTDNTVVLFMTDNGQPSSMPRNLPLRGHKLTPYEGGIRVPLIARWPGVTPAGATCTQPVMIDDIFPTLAEIASIDDDKLPSPIDGESFASLLRTPNTAPPETPRSFFWHFPNTYNQPPYTAMRRGKWKMIYHHIDQRLELFDLENDISEAHDLAADEPVVLQSLAEMMSAHLRETDADMPRLKPSGKTLPMPEDVLGE